MLNDMKSFPPTKEFVQQALIQSKDYQQLYKQSIEQPDLFWQQQAEQLLDWGAPWEKLCEDNLAKGEVSWFQGGKLNACVNCLDRHLPKHAKKTALIWESNEPGHHKHITYQALHESVCKAANVLLSMGIQKGDRVCLYMPMVPEAIVAMLACARIGAIHSVVFAGFSAQALSERINDAQACCVITADGGMRGQKIIPLKESVDEALRYCPSVKRVLVVQRIAQRVNLKKDRDYWWHEVMAKVPAKHEAEMFDAETPLFTLYTSGSTGKPKGVLHSTAGYLLQAALSFRTIFDYKPQDIYWCTADIGWVTGHSYVLYGPMANAATQVIYEGVPTYPDHSRVWQIVDTHQVSIFYTAPTLIRALMAAGNEPLTTTHRESLRLLGTVGEPINPEAWLWYYQQVGHAECPIVDTWWQTETGSIMLTPFPGAMPLKPGCAMKPFFGVQPVLLTEEGKEIPGAGAGYLAFKGSWPSIMRGIYNNPQRFTETYLQSFPGYYLSGDAARRDEDGDYWITGRVDDVINVSGHRLGTAEIESAFVAHTAVAETAVVGIPHAVKGEGICAFVRCNDGIVPSDALKLELIALVREIIGAIASPDEIHFVADLPKTRSGKIMRRILRKISRHDTEFGDVSTLADPQVIAEINDSVATEEEN